jgi:hypothetical protein
MKNTRSKVWVLLGPCWMLACGSAGEDAAKQTPSVAASARENAFDVKSRKSFRQSERPLGPDERRVVVFVVPGDALVEIDGQRVTRRSGVVELVGKVGEVHRLRAWKGDKSTETKEITIAESGANPSFVDVYEVKPTAKNMKSKPQAARFDVDE